MIFVLCAALVAGFAQTVAAQDIGRLADLIKTGNSENKRDALHQLLTLRLEAASRAAVPALSDADEIVRATAANAVIFLPPAEAARVLTPLLNDKAEFVRLETAYALGETRAADAVPALVGALQKDRSIMARSAAVSALGKIGSVSAVTALESILRRPANDNEAFLRRSAARSIGEIAEIGRAGRHQTATPQDFLPEKYKVPVGPVTRDALSAFHSSVLTLINVAASKRETDDTRREAAYALGAIGDSAATAFLTQNLSNPDNYLAEICKEALLKISKTE